MRAVLTCPFRLLLFFCFTKLRLQCVHSAFNLRARERRKYIWYWRTRCLARFPVESRETAFKIRSTKRVTVFIMKKLVINIQICIAITKFTLLTFLLVQMLQLTSSAKVFASFYGYQSYAKTDHILSLRCLISDQESIWPLLRHENVPSKYCFMWSSSLVLRNIFRARCCPWDTPWRCRYSHTPQTA